MKLLVDSREQRPLKFGCDWERKCLPVGDYGASFKEGHLHGTIWERKGLGDLFGSLTLGYDRFRRMFQKAAELNITVIIAVEGTREKVLKGYEHSARDPKSILVQLETIEKKYGIKTVFFGNRIAMANHIHDYYREEYEKWYDSPERS